MEIILALIFWHASAIFRVPCTFTFHACSFSISHLSTSVSEAVWITISGLSSLKSFITRSLLVMSICKEPGWSSRVPCKGVTSNLNLASSTILLPNNPLAPVTNSLWLRFKLSRQRHVPFACTIDECYYCFNLFHDSE